MTPCVYFMTEEGRGEDIEAYVKIGWCVDVCKRLEAVQLGNPRKVKLLGCVDGGREMESHFHERFKSYRCRGEWFRLCGELKAFVEGLGGRVMNRARSWVPVVDEDGNAAVPDTERSVLVFLCGDRDLIADRPADAGHGERFGYFDHDRRFWRVGGAWEPYVTHWMDLPDPPATAR